MRLIETTVVPDYKKRHLDRIVVHDLSINYRVEILEVEGYVENTVLPLEISFIDGKVYFSLQTYIMVVIEGEVAVNGLDVLPNYRLVGIVIPLGYAID